MMFNIQKLACLTYFMKPSPPSMSYLISFRNMSKPAYHNMLGYVDELEKPNHVTHSQW